MPDEPLPTGSLATAAWVLVGMTRNVPGILATDGQRLTFASAEEVLLDSPMEEISEVVFPWYYFGGGCKLRVGDERIRLSFVRPNNAPDATDTTLNAARDRVLGSLPGGQLHRAVGSLRDIGKGRAAGKAWRSVLTGSGVG
ncbi:MAG: hypothetical protein WD080_11945 [Egibacteraceae bacterium]